MREKIVKVGLFLAVLFWVQGPVYAQDAKGLAPGWFSLDSTVGVVDKKIEEGKSAVEKALFGIKISGFWDVSYHYSFNNPINGADDITGRAFQQDHNEINLDSFKLVVEKDEKDWGVGFRIDANFGRTAEFLREATLWGSKFQTPGVNGGEPSVELQQAFLTTTIPLGKGIQVTGGKFVTLHGAEVIESKDNPNISYSFPFYFAIPLTHTGVRGKYVFTDMIDLTLGVNTGWDNPRDNNNQPSYEGRLGFTFSDKYTLAVAWMAGPEWLTGDARNNQPRDRIGRNRALLDVVAIAKPTSQLTFIFNYDYGTEDQVPVGDGRRDTHWNGLAAYAIYGWTDRFSTAVRGDYISDSTGSRVLHGRLWGLTLTPAYKFTEKLIGRAEYRHEWSSRNFFSKGRTATDKDQGIFALQATYAF